MFTCIAIFDKEVYKSNRPDSDESNFKNENLVYLGCLDKVGYRVLLSRKKSIITKQNRGLGLNHSNAFSLKTHRFRYVFTSRPHCNDRKRRPSFSETETFENASESGDIWKRIDTF